MATCLESDVTTFAFGELPGFDESYSQNVLNVVLIFAYLFRNQSNSGAPCFLSYHVGILLQIPPGSLKMYDIGRR